MKNSVKNLAWQKGEVAGITFVQSPLIPLPGILCRYVKTRNWELLLIAQDRTLAQNGSCAYEAGDLCLQYRHYPHNYEFLLNERTAVKTLCHRFARACLSADKIGADSFAKEPFSLSVSEVLEKPLEEFPETRDVRCLVFPWGQKDVGIRIVSRDANLVLNCVAKARSPGQSGILDWNFRLDLLTHTAQLTKMMVEYLLVKIAACLTIYPGPDSTERTDGSDEFFFDLARPVDMNELIAVTRVGTTLGSLRVSLDLPTRCSERCSFCLVPLEPVREGEVNDSIQQEGYFRARQIIDYLGRLVKQGWKIDLDIQGRDALAFGKLLELLDFIENAGISKVTIITPATHLADRGLVEALAKYKFDLRITTTIHGPTADIHDRIAGRQGSFEDLLAAISNCQSAGIFLQLNHVTVKQNYLFLPQTLKFIRNFGLPLRIYAFFTEKSYPRKLVLQNIVRYSDLRPVFQELADEIADMRVELHNFPLCQIPSLLRRWAFFNAPAYRKGDESLPPACLSCSLFGNSCFGPDSWYLTIFGSSEFQSL